ncbi:MAG: DNA polymerase III subunit chi [Acidiferrobacteraceae bacterium]
MTRVDFYLLEQDGLDTARFACRLIDKAFRLGHRIYVLTPDADAGGHLDELLWTFQAGSFVPHATVGPGLPAEESPPVLIGWGEPPEDAHDVLVPLTPDVPAFFARFDRVVEIVGADSGDKERSRAHFRFYRDRGYPLEVHRL